MRFPIYRSLIFATLGLLGVVLGGVVFYWLALQGLQQAEMGRLQARAEQRATELRAKAREAETYVRALAANSVVRTLAAGDGGEVAEADQLRRLEEDLLATMRANLRVQQLRLIMADEAGRELVRVDRKSIWEDVRVVGPEQLQEKGHRDYVRRGRTLEPGQVMLVPISLNREEGQVELPYRLVARAVARTEPVEGGPSVLVVANVDVTREVEAWQRESGEGLKVYLLGEDGAFLSHPDPARRFGVELGTGFTAEREFANWESMRHDGAAQRQIERDGPGHWLGYVEVPVLVRSAPEPVVLARVVMRATDRFLEGTAGMVLRTSMPLAALVAVGLAVLAIVMWRAVARPLDTILPAVAAYRGGGTLRIPVRVGSTFKPLAQAVERMSALLHEQSEALEMETNERQVSQQAMETIMSGMPDAVLVVDEKRRVAFANPRACRLFERKAEALLGTPCPLQFECDQVLELQYGEQSAKRRLEVRAVELGWMRRTAQLVVIRDVTEVFVLSEQLRQSAKMRALGQLAAGIAHDFNNALAVMTMSAEMLTKCEQDDVEQAKELQDELRVATRRARDLTRQLLIFSRGDEGEARPINLSDLLVGLLKMLRRTLAPKVTVQTSLEADLYLVDARESEIEQVVVNLAINARDAMPQGGKLQITTSNRVFEHPLEVEGVHVPPGHYAVLEVADNGSGMTPEVKAQVFDPFFTTKDRGKGTGMGLANVFAIVERHDGVVALHSEPGQGTCFSIYLPQTLRTVEATTGSEENLLELASCHGSERVLVVEDEPVLARLMVVCLEEYGYAVEHVLAGEEALLRLQDDSQAAVDLIIADVLSPGMGGLELSVELSARGLEVAELLISGSSNCSEEEARAALARGARFLGKPFTPSVLVKMVREVCDERKRG
ncbi:hybrid sensor histidine kinase/response regulator [Actomonas aquatica]|uniref:histidine kinase n=1 Tax=Actomonas aquatica TaxID=2866162 RepID=A0ABZ1C4H1_9BACT|nr:ATP-binding protein [Opitutus sp. WL0086]WRQ86297.1 ATP-binding protein [Opitutus sp. WL0086]